MAKLVSIRLTENELRALCFPTFSYRVMGDDADTTIDVLRTVKARVVDYKADPWEFFASNDKEGGPYAFVDDLTKPEVRHCLALMKFAGRAATREESGMGGWPASYCLAEDEEKDPGTWMSLRDKLQLGLKGFSGEAKRRDDDESDASKAAAEKPAKADGE